MRRPGKAKQPAGGFRGHAGRGRNRVQNHAAALPQCGKDHRARETSGADATDPEIPRSARPHRLRRIARRNRHCGQGPDRIFHQHRIRAGIFQLPIGCASLLHRTTLLDERRDLDRPRSQQLQKGLHVALLRPAHIADGIIQTFFFVQGIVAARAVRTRKDQRQFFHVHGLAGDAEIDRAHDHDAPAIAANPRGQFDGFGRRRCRGNNCDIGAVTGKFLRS